MRILLTMPCSNVMLNIILTLYAGYIVLARGMLMANRPVDPGSIQGSQRPAVYPS